MGPHVSRDRVPHGPALSEPQAPTFTGPYRPLQLRAANALGSILGARSPRLDLPALVRASGVKGARLDEPADIAFVARLQALLDDANGPARLHYVGRWVLRLRLADATSNRLRLRQWLHEHPQTLAVPVEQPLFVVGPPRSGTTLLYSLLAQDPQARAPRLWEVNVPVPPPVPDGGREDPRLARSRRQLARLTRYVPQLAVAHGLDPDHPEECFPLLETSALSAAYLMYLHVPSYWERLLAATPADVRDAYATYRAQVQVLMMRGQGRRWVSKSPAHLPFLAALAEAFPGARFAVTHREPEEAIASLASLVAITRSASSDHVDLALLGRTVLAASVQAAQRAQAARDTLEPEAFADVRYPALLADPVGVVRTIYERFGLPFTRVFERRMQGWLAAHPQHAHGVHRYALAQFGLTAAGVRGAMGDYRARYFAE